MPKENRRYDEVLILRRARAHPSPTIVANARRRHRRTGPFWTSSCRSARSWCNESLVWRKSWCGEGPGARKAPSPGKAWCGKARCRKSL